MNNKDYIEGMEHQLILISNEIDLIKKLSLVDGDRNQGLLSGAYGLMTQAKANLALLEIEDRKEEND